MKIRGQITGVAGWGLVETSTGAKVDQDHFPNIKTQRSRLIDQGQKLGIKR